MSWFKSKINETGAALAELQEQFASVSSELEAVREELKGAQEQAATFLAEFTRVDAESKEKDTRISSLETELAEASRDAAEFDDKVAAKAASEIATMGHAPLEIVEDEPHTDVLSTFKSLRGNEMVKYFNENKAALQDALRRGA